MSPVEKNFLKAATLFVHCFISHKVDVEVDRLENERGEKTDFSVRNVQRVLESHAEILREALTLFEEKVERHVDSDHELRHSVFHLIQRVPNLNDRRILDYLLLFVDTCASTSFFDDRKSSLSFVLPRDILLPPTQEAPTPRRQPLRFHFPFS